MKKRWIIPILLLALAVQPVRADHDEYRAKAMILFEPITGAVIFEKNADEEMLIASTTKIMTALVVLEHCELDEVVCPTPEQISVEGSSMYLRAGEEYTVEELLYGLLLASGNDAALVLAEHTAGSCEAFSALMNGKCSELGLRHTHFQNPHGLDAPEHYASARDLALITAEAMKNPVFCRMFSTSEIQIHDVTYVNHNKLLTSCEGCIGGKTGYTRAAGRVLVSCTERNGMRLICVTISDPDDWTDHRNAYDAAFARYRFYPLPDPAWEKVLVLSGSAESVSLTCRCPGILLPADAEPEMQVCLPRFLFAPVTEGQEIGLVTVYSNGKTVACVPLKAAEKNERNEKDLLTLREQFQRSWERYCRYSRYSVYPVLY